MTILHLGLGWIGDASGGLERYQDGVCTAHAAMGQPTTALVQSSVAVDDSSANYRVVGFDQPGGPRRRRRSRLRDAFAAHATDVPIVVSHHASVASGVLDLMGDRDLVVHFHGPWAAESRQEGASWLKSAIQRLVERRIYHASVRLTTLSEAFKTVLVQRYGVPQERVEVVPGGIDVDVADPGGTRAAARRRLGWPTDRPILVCIRRLIRRVGVDQLITATAELVRQHPDTLVMIGGRGPEREPLSRLIDQLGLGQHVRLLGFVSQDDLPWAYRAADASVVPTRSWEGFGLVILESLAAGTPAVVTPIGSLPEVVGPLSESLITSKASPAALAQTLGEVLSGSAAVPDEEACRRYVRSRYDWSVVAPRVLEVYRGSPVAAP